MLKTWWSDFKRIPYFDEKWFLTWIIIFVSFIGLDIMAPGFWGSSLLKYAGIFLCVVYANQKYEKDYKLVIALFFTFLADTILVWTPYEIAGVFVFCFAQLMHFIRLAKVSRKWLLYFTAIVSGLVIIVGLRHDNILYSLAALYGSLLFTNLGLSIRRYRTHNKDFRARCAMYGFIAFVGCDLCVGIRHLMLDGIIPAQFLPLVAFMVWIFYYPSQVLLANSSTEPIRTTPHKLLRKKSRKVAKKSSLS